MIYHLSLSITTFLYLLCRWVMNLFRCALSNLAACTDMSLGTPILSRRYSRDVDSLLEMAGDRLSKLDG